MTDNLLASSSHPSRLLLVTQKPIFLALPVNLSGLRQPGLCEANIPGVVFFFILVQSHGAPVRGVRWSHRGRGSGTWWEKKNYLQSAMKLKSVSLCKSKWHVLEAHGGGSVFHVELGHWDTSDCHLRSKHGCRIHDGRSTDLQSEIPTKQRERFCWLLQTGVLSIKQAAITCCNKCNF